MYTDGIKMFGGKYSGHLLTDIPASYFIYLYESRKWGHHSVRNYIEQNFNTLIKNGK